MPPSWNEAGARNPNQCNFEGERKDWSGLGWAGLGWVGLGLGLGLAWVVTRVVNFNREAQATKATEATAAGTGTLGPGLAGTGSESGRLPCVPRPRPIFPSPPPAIAIPLLRVAGSRLTQVAARRPPCSPSHPSRPQAQCAMVERLECLGWVGVARPRWGTIDGTDASRGQEMLAAPNPSARTL